LEKNVATNLKKLGITDKNIKFDPKDKARDSTGPTSATLKVDQKLLAKAKQDISQYGQAVQQLMNTAPQARNTFNQLFTVYVNKRIVQGDLNNLLEGFMEFVSSRPMTDKMRAKIDEHLEANKEGLIGAFTIWIDIYNLKKLFQDPVA
jgi:hypothetical protein